MSLRVFRLDVWIEAYLEVPIRSSILMRRRAHSSRRVSFGRCRWIFRCTLFLFLGAEEQGHAVALEDAPNVRKRFGLLESRMRPFLDLAKVKSHEAHGFLTYGP